MQTLADIITTARQIAADEDLPVEVTDEGVIRTTTQDPKDFCFRQLHIGADVDSITGVARTALAITWEAEEDAGDYLEDGDCVSVKNEELVRWKLREALHDVNNDAQGY